MVKYLETKEKRNKKKRNIRERKGIEALFKIKMPGIEESVNFNANISIRQVE